MGAAAAEMLVKLMRGVPVDPPCVDVGFTLVVRAST
jgi:DNA-binding LacI/PurR family transcriptional regulator